MEEVLHKEFSLKFQENSKEGKGFLLNRTPVYPLLLHSALSGQQAPFSFVDFVKSR